MLANYPEMENRAENIPDLRDILSEKQLNHILSNTAKAGAEILSFDLSSASSGLAGFFGDHLRLTLHVKEDAAKKIHLFIKCLPRKNQTKADFISQQNLNKREALIYKLLEEMEDSEDPNPWRPKAYIYTENIIVMPDLRAEGYQPCSVKKYLDKNHVMVAATSIARFHATFTNYLTKKTINEHNPYDILAEYDHIMADPMFSNSSWLRAAAKLNSNFLKEFSKKYNEYPSNLEELLVDLYLKACDRLRVYEDTLNVFIHKDLWTNNVLFRYCDDFATNAVILDYQCVRVAPPAYDVMTFLYFNTSRTFRESQENEVFQHYYNNFLLSLNSDSRQRLDNMNYDFDSFLNWCERARLFGILLPAAVFPFVMMDPQIAQKTFDDPEIFTDLMEKDRSGPVIEHARENDVYRQRQLELCEEIVEKYILNNLEK